MTGLKQLCIDLEHFETPEWAARAILKKEILTKNVVDPCCGAGVLAKAAMEAGYNVIANDIHDWDFRPHNDGDDMRCFGVSDFLKMHGGWLSGYDEETRTYNPSSIFMNPPFSKACEFVEKSSELGARKIVCFQRFAWWESSKRRQFWEKYPPARVYICGNRADCWRHDLPKDEKGNRFDPVTGKKLAGTPTAHAWFVWEDGAPPGTLLGHIYREGVA